MGETPNLKSDGKPVSAGALRFDPYELSHRVLSDKNAPPVALLAAYRCVYHGEPEPITDLAYEAAWS